MPRQAVLATFFGLITWLLVRDVRRRPDVSSATWLVVIWAVIFASRPVSEWMTGPAVTSVDGYLEGSPTDRLVSLVLIFAAYVVILHRRASLPTVFRQNGALFAFYAFWAVSVLWSDYPFVAFKRWFKDFGAVVMVLVVLTDANPIQAAKAVFVRAAYLLVPMSFMFVRFIPEIGRAYAGYNQNELMYIGVATHKNTLGALLLVSCIFLVWDLVGFKQVSTRKSRLAWVDSAIVLLMSLWLLRIANSATALACTFIGVGIYLLTGVGVIKRRLRFVELYAIVGGLLWYAADSVFHVTELIVLSLGRDMTLTTRTDAWQLFLNLDINPLIGAGFKSFWVGDRMARIWADFPGIVQAHNGYLETYLEGGALGLIFLTVLLLVSFKRIKRQLIVGDDFARVRLAFWVVALVYNFSEAAFSQLSLLWIVTLLVVTERVQPVMHAPAAVPRGVPTAAPAIRSWRPPRGSVATRQHR